MVKHSKNYEAVTYYTPNKPYKKIGTSQIATSQLLAVLTMNKDITFNELYNKINYDQEAKEIVLKYIELGYGDTIPNFGYFRF